MDSDFASVTEQSGLKAGDQGFNVNVANNTDLKGDAITSTQKAIDNNKNNFSTGGTLTTSDIQNQASYKASSVGVSIGTGVSLDGKLAPQGTSAGFGKDSGNASSTTQAAISGVAGNKDARTGDAETGIAKIFDADKVQKDIDAQVRITQTFSREAPKAVASFAQNQANELKAKARQETDPDKKAALEAEARKWEEGGVYRIALHTATGALAGGVDEVTTMLPVFPHAEHRRALPPVRRCRPHETGNGPINSFFSRSISASGMRAINQSPCKNLSRGFG